MLRLSKRSINSNIKGHERMTTIFHRSAAILGAAALLVFALPTAHAQTATDPNAPAATPAPPDATAPPTDTTSPPVNANPATPEPTPNNSTPPASSSRFRIGPAIGFYLPSSSKTRNRFGDDWISVGIGLGSISAITTKGKLGFDASIFYHGRDSNHVFFLPIGINYRVALAPGTKVVPYIGVSANVDFTDITSNPDNVHNSFNVGGGGSGFVGLNFGDSAFVEARYYALSKANGFDLSGLSLDAGYRF
jgi:hypothetical protein